MEDIPPLIVSDRPLGGGKASIDQIKPLRGNVIVVRLQVRRQGQGGRIIQVVIFLRHIPRYVWMEKTYHQHEGIGMSFLQALDRPIRGYRVAHICLGPDAVVAQIEPPVSQCSGSFVIQIGRPVESYSLSCGILVTIKGIPSSRQIDTAVGNMPVENFPHRHRFITVVAQIGMQQGGAHGFDPFFNLLIIGLRSTRVELRKIDATHKAGSRRTAKRVGTVGTWKMNPFAGESIHIGCDRIRMPGETREIIQIVHANKKHIRVLSGQSARGK